MVHVTITSYELRILFIILLFNLQQERVKMLIYMCSVTFKNIL